MRTRDAKRISRYLDGELEPSRRDETARAMQASEAAQRMKADFESIGSRLRETPVPEGQPADAAWADVRRRLRQGRQDVASPAWVFGSRLQWAGAMMIAAWLGLAVWVSMHAGGPADPAQVAGLGTEVEWVETGVPGASTMLYQDDETGLTVIWMMEPDEEGSRHADS